jgi:hypothetical protein
MLNSIKLTTINTILALMEWNTATPSRNYGHLRDYLDSKGLDTTSFPDWYKNVPKTMEVTPISLALLVIRASEGASGEYYAPGESETPVKPQESFKGVSGGLCNRIACLKPGAVFYNSSTRAYYCPECAAKINYWSRKDDGIDLCTLDTLPVE